MKKKCLLYSSALALILACIMCSKACNNRNNLTIEQQAKSGIYYIEEIDRAYSYELKVYGTLPNAISPVSFYVYTDDATLTTWRIMNSLVSSQKSEYDFYVSEKAVENGKQILSICGTNSVQQFLVMAL